MLTRLKSKWRQLSQGKPGHRFVDRYNHRNEKTKGRLNVRKIVDIGLGVVLVVVGIVFLPAPGPGSFVLIIGLGLMGNEIRWMARALDWSEVRLREGIHWSKAYWKRASLPTRSIICLLATAIAVVVGYGMVRWYMAISR